MSNTASKAKRIKQFKVNDTVLYYQKEYTVVETEVKPAVCNVHIKAKDYPYNSLWVNCKSVEQIETETNEGVDNE